MYRGYCDIYGDVLCANHAAFQVCRKRKSNVVSPPQLPPRFIVDRLQPSMFFKWLATLWHVSASHDSINLGHSCGSSTFKGMTLPARLRLSNLAQINFSTHILSYQHSKGSRCFRPAHSFTVETFYRTCQLSSLLHLLVLKFYFVLLRDAKPLLCCCPYQRFHSSKLYIPSNRLKMQRL